MNKWKPGDKVYMAYPHKFSEPQVMQLTVNHVLADTAILVESKDKRFYAQSVLLGRTPKEALQRLEDATANRLANLQGELARRSEELALTEDLMQRVKDAIAQED